MWERGFTIIELLVVIAVISILMGIILPVLPMVRDSALRAGCGSNLRQIGMPLQTYLGDNKLKYPDARSMPDPWLTLQDEKPSFNHAIRDYLEIESEVYRCPGDKEVYDVEYIDEQGETRKGRSSYSFLISLAGIRYEESFFKQRLDWQSTDHPVLQEFDGSNLEYHTTLPEGPTDTVNPGFFHSTRNILFVDGHVGQFE